MGSINLKPLSIEYAPLLAHYISEEKVRTALGLKLEDCTIYAMEQFIRLMHLEEMEGHFYSRMIWNEADEFVGVITLKHIDVEKKYCHMGTWLGEPYWRKGYNRLAKEQMLNVAFEQLGLERVFVGARKRNLRSRISQQKTPYITLRVEKEYPKEYERLEKLEGAPCILNVIEKENYMTWIANRSVNH